MISAKRLIILCTVILCTISVLATAQNQRLRITGTMLDNKTGEPVAGVKVVAYMRHKPAVKIEKVSDDQGKFKITGLQAGPAIFEFTKDGYKPSGTAHRVNSMKATEKVIFRIEKIVRSGGSITPEIKERYDKASAFYKEGKVDESLSIYLQLIQEFPDLHQIHNNIAIAYSAKKDFDKALEHFQIVLDNNPENAQVIIFTGDIYLAKDEKEKALEWYIKAANLKVDFYWVANQIADVARSMDNYKLSAEYYLRALAIDPKKPLPHLYLGTFLALEKKYDDSIKHCFIYIQLDPAGAGLSMAKGIIDESLDKFENSEQFFRDVITQSGSEPLAHFYLGVILARKGGTEAEAATCLRMYLELDPDDFYKASEETKEFLEVLK